MLDSKVVFIVLYRKNTDVVVKGGGDNTSRQPTENEPFRRKPWRIYEGPAVIACP